MSSLWLGNPEVWALSPIPWQFFCSLTFRGIGLANPSLKAGVVRVTMWFSLFRAFARKFGVAQSKILWCLRQEAGEVGGRMHLHALIGGVPGGLVNDRTSMWLMHQWEHELRGGYARIRVFDPSLAGVDYTLKDLLETGIDAANAYESCKFSRSDQVLVSKSVVRLLTAYARRDRLSAN